MLSLIHIYEFAKNKNLSSIAKIALEILHGLEAQPCENNNGVVNGQDLKKYAKELLEAAKSEYLERPAMDLSLIHIYGLVVKDNSLNNWSKSFRLTLIIGKMRHT